jgi:hypothetical protein
MVRAEFAYQDTTAPTASAALLQHPLFPEQVDVALAGSEPLHPGSSTGTLTPPGGGSPVVLLFERLLGDYGVYDPTPVLLQEGTSTLAIIAFDRYGGFSDTLSTEVAATTLAAGRPARLRAAGPSGEVSLEVSPLAGGGTTLLLIPYQPETLPPGGPTGKGGLPGTPIVSLGPATWAAPLEGAELGLPLPGIGIRSGRLERWDGRAWQPVPGTVRFEGTSARAWIPGGGWYRLAEGTAPLPATATAVPELLGNWPNPFNPQTRIRFRIPAERAGSRARLSVLNIRGQQVRVLLDEVVGVGERTVTWDGRDAVGEEVASGIYFYRLEIDSVVLTRKMVLLR